MTDKGWFFRSRDARLTDSLSNSSLTQVLSSRLNSRPTKVTGPGEGATFFVAIILFHSTTLSHTHRVHSLLAEFTFLPGHQSTRLSLMHISIHYCQMPPDTEGHKQLKGNGQECLLRPLKQSADANVKVFICIHLPRITALARVTCFLNKFILPSHVTNIVLLRIT